MVASLLLFWLFMDDLSNSTCSTEGAIIPSLQLGQREDILCDRRLEKYNRIGDCIVIECTCSFIKSFQPPTHGKLCKSTQ